MNTTTTQSPKHKRFRLVSFNTNNCLCRPRQRWKVLRLLRATHAHVFCLQEVMKRDDVDWLLQHLGSFFACPAWHRGGMCVIVNTQFAHITGSRVLPLKRSWCNALVGARVRFHGSASSVWCYSVHLDSRDYRRNETRRLNEVSQILKLVHAQQHVVLAGDWNSVCHRDRPHHSPALQPSALLAQHFVDGHREAKNVSRTWIPSTDQRIDRIHVKRVRVCDAGTLSPESLFSRWPTGRDHCLVFADLAISRQRTLVES